MTLRRLVPVLTAGLLVPLSRQLPAFDQPAQAPVFRSDVSLVLMPVFVIDKDGKAVRGLTAADFDVEQDGRRAEVVSFRYVDTTDVEEQDELRIASAARRRFLLLFDKSFTDLPGLDRSRRAARDFVRLELTPSDLAAVATFDIQNGVRLVANFTEDRALLSHAIATLGVPSITRIADPLGLAADLAITDLQATQAADESPIPQLVVDSFARAQLARMRSADEQTYLHNVNTLLEGLDLLAEALRRVEGRKQVLYFSAGFDSRVLVGQSGSEQRLQADAIARGQLWEIDSMARFGDSRLRESLGRTTRSLAAADTVVHSIDVTGLGSDSSLTQSAASQDIVRNTTNRESLGFFARETGGRLFDNANELGPALAEMLEMTSRYYVLGFQPRPSRGAGAFHKVRVRVARKGVKLSHRAGYYERGPAAGQTWLQRQFEAAQLVMSGALDDLRFSSLCLPFPGPGERQAVGVVIQVPRSSLRWTAGKAVELEAYGYAVSPDGVVVDHLAKHARLDLRQLDPEDGSGGVSLFGTLAVPPGRYTLRLLVRDVESGAAGVQFIDVSVPRHDPKVGFLLPPVVMDEASRWLSVEVGRARAAGEPREAFPFRFGGQPFLPRASFEVRPGGNERLVLFAYEPEAAGDPAADLSIRASLRDRAGTLVKPGSVRIEKMHREPSGLRTYVLGYTPEPHEAGDYTLRVGVGEGGALLESYALIRLRPAS
jgi:VWFA-related protein